MNKFSLKTISLLSFTLLLSSKPIPQSNNYQSIATNNNLFAFDLYQNIAKKKQGNIFISPFSISTALAMTFAGANEDNAAEIANTMHFSGNTPDFHKSYGNYIKKIEKNAKGNIQLKIANRLWGERDYKFNEVFLSTNEKAYNSSLQKMDFKSSAEPSRITINKWVETQTENRIKDLIPQGGVTSDTRLVLTNAIYFNGDWLYQFKKKNTKDRKFYLNKKHSKRVPFMNFKGGLQYTQNKNYQMLRLPYKGNKQSMIIVLPWLQDSLASVEKSINTASFQNLYYSYTPTVILALPKFKMTLPLNLNSILIELGMKKAFYQGADFSKMSPNNDLFISSVVHKAFIEIDEKGTEAAAATAVIMTIESVSANHIPKPIEFIADHPFLFYIVDDETKAILFMGRLMAP